jgi:hypothetical protein
MSFAVPKDGPHLRTSSSIRPKSAGAIAQSPAQPIPRPRSPIMKAPTPKQNIRRSDDNFADGGGNAGNDVVMRIFEKIHETTGGGGAAARCSRKQNSKSARSKLRNLDTGPTEKILKHQMWKDYFSSTENSNNNSHASKEKKRGETETTRVKQGQRRGNGSGGADTDHPDDNTEMNYQRLYHRLVKRINHLWKELKIPLSDRDFYSVAIIKERFSNIDQIDNLACYVKRLLDHRNDTIQVIQAIRDREYVMEQCNALISVSLRHYNAKYSTLHDDIARNIEKQDPSGVDRERQVHEEIKTCIYKLQQMSCQVIRVVRTWRDGLWRPQPFLYRGCNYLIKMQSDMDFLRSKSVQRILADIPLAPRDLVCVLFDSAAGAGPGGSTRTRGFDDTVDEHGNDLHHASDDTATPQRGGEREASTDEPHDHNDISGAVLRGGVPPQDLPPPTTPAVAATTAAISTPEPHQGQERGRERATHGMEDLTVVILNESSVQRALKIETAALHARGTFIPSLRFELDDDSDANLLKNS